jgi:DNA-binding NarL/FixJ family response regulator
MTTLSKRKVEVMKLAAEGLVDKEIADKMNLSYAAIKSHIHQALKITDCRSRTELVYKLAKENVI